MAYEIGKAYCGLCLRRQKDEGGDGTCPLPRFDRLRRQGSPKKGHDCASFKLGDVRRAK